MELHTHIVRVPFKLEDFTTLTGLVFPDELQPSRFNALDEIGVHLVSVPMPFINRISGTVEGAYLRSFRLPQRRTASQAHGAAEMRL